MPILFLIACFSAEPMPQADTAAPEAAPSIYVSGDDARAYLDAVNDEACFVEQTCAGYSDAEWTPIACDIAWELTPEQIDPFHAGTCADLAFVYPVLVEGGAVDRTTVCTEWLYTFADTCGPARLAR